LHKQQKPIFHSTDNKVNVSVYFEKDNFWTQKTMMELFGVERSVVTKHLTNIFQTAELEDDSARAKIALLLPMGKITRPTSTVWRAILAVGCRVNLSQATDFRKWTT
jgi:hypothetical protein